MFIFIFKTLSNNNVLWIHIIHFTYRTEMREREREREKEREREREREINIFDRIFRAC